MSCSSMLQNICRCNSMLVGLQLQLTEILQKSNFLMARDNNENDNIDRILGGKGIFVNGQKVKPGDAEMQKRLVLGIQNRQRKNAKTEGILNNQKTRIEAQISARQKELEGYQTMLNSDISREFKINASQQ